MFNERQQKEYQRPSTHPSFCSSTPFLLTHVADNSTLQAITHKFDSSTKSSSASGANTIGSFPRALALAAARATRSLDPVLAITGAGAIGKSIMCTFPAGFATPFLLERGRLSNSLLVGLGDFLTLLPVGLGDLATCFLPGRVLVPVFLAVARSFGFRTVRASSGAGEGDVDSALPLIRGDWRRPLGGVYPAEASVIAVSSKVTALPLPFPGAPCGGVVPSKVKRPQTTSPFGPSVLLWYRPPVYGKVSGSWPSPLASFGTLGSGCGMPPTRCGHCVLFLSAIWTRRLRSNKEGPSGEVYWRLNAVQWRIPG